MVLKCGKHFTEEANRYQLGEQRSKQLKFESNNKSHSNSNNNDNLRDMGLKGGNYFDSEDEDADAASGSGGISNLLSDINHHLESDACCKMILKLKTGADGYWKVNEYCEANREIYHDPPLVKTSSYFKKLKEK